MSVTSESGHRFGGSLAEEEALPDPLAVATISINFATVASTKLYFLEQSHRQKECSHAGGLALLYAHANLTDPSRVQFINLNLDYTPARELNSQTEKL